MMRLLIAAAIFLAVSMPAQAGHRHRHRDHGHQAHHSMHRHHAARRFSHRRRVARAAPERSARHGRQHLARGAVRHGGGIVTVQTVAGPITVASHLAERFKALIADFVAAGYKPRHIGCLAHGGHVPNSRHYAGAACDFDQRGWGLTAPFMYHARAIIARHGFRDGCSFNDCGHVDDGQSLRHAQRRWRSYAEDDS